MTRRRRSPDRGQQGFTLPEVMIAAILAVIGLAGVLSMQIAAARGNQGASQFTDGTVFAKEALEAFRGMTIAEMETRFGPLPIVDFQLTDVTGRANVPYERWFNATPLAASPELIHLRIEVRWTEGGAVMGSDGGKWDRKTSLELVRTRKEAL